MISTPPSETYLKGRKPLEFLTRHRVGFLDLDPYGHMSGVHYIRYIVEHRFSQMKDVLGWDQNKVQSLPVGFFTNRIEINYSRPLGPDEDFEIRSFVSQTTEATCIVEVEFRKLNGKVAASALLHLSNVDRKTGRLTPFTEDIISPFFHPVET